MHKRDTHPRNTGSERDWFLGLGGVVVTQIQSVASSPAMLAFCLGVPCLDCLLIRYFLDFARGGLLEAEVAAELLRMNPKGPGYNAVGATGAEGLWIQTHWAGEGLGTSSKPVSS